MLCKGAHWAGALALPIPFAEISLLLTYPPNRHSLLGSQVPFTVGAVFFLFGAWVTTRMWKAEQFGLAFMNEINDFAPAAPNSTMPVRSACGVALGGAMGGLLQLSP